MSGRRFRRAGSSDTPGGGLSHRARAGILVGAGVFAFAGLATVIAQAVTPPAYAATASLHPALYYIGDSNGSYYVFTVENTGTTASIGAVEINRPTTWTVISCPNPPAGWTAQVSATKCRFRSAASTADDIKPGQSKDFTVRARTDGGINNRVGTWGVVVSKSNQFDNPSLLKNATPTGPGLTATLYTFEVIDAVVADSPVVPGTGCPPANKTALVDSTKVIVICGKNRATASLWPNAANSTLTGTYIQSTGTFTSAPIVKNSGNVVLGNWQQTHIANTFGTGTFKIITSIGSAANRTSPLRTFTGYSTTSHPPTVANDAYSTDEDTPLSVPAATGVLANDSDVDGDPITAVLVSGPAHDASFALNPDGSFSYTPDPDYNGPDSFTYKANDGHVDSAPATVNLTVNPINDPPVATDDTATVPEDSTGQTVSVLANDVDVDADTLAVTALDTTGTTGTVTITNAGADVSYDPNGQFESLTTGQTATTTFQYTVSDGNGGTDTATVTITITGSNDPPNAVDDTDSTDEASTTLVNVVGNDTDAESAFTVTSVDTTGTSGSVTDNNDGTVTYDPNGAFESLGNGDTDTDTFTYTITDAGGATDTATVTVTINGINDAPVGVDDTATVPEDSAGQTVNVLGNDTDAESQNLTVDAVDTTGTTGTVTITNAGADVSYDPNGQFEYLTTGVTATDVFTYTVKDSQGGTDTATVTITITGSNDLPNAVDDTGSTDEASTTLVNVLVNDSDTEGAVTVTDVDTTGTSGTVTDNGDGTVTYDPNGAFESLGNGDTDTDTFAYTITDEDGGTDTAVVTITVNGINDAPVGVDDTATVPEDSTGQVVTVLGNDTDAESQTLAVTNVDTTGTTGTVTITNGGADVTYDPNGQFESLAAGETGTDVFTYTVSDGQGGTDTATVTITVSGSNDAPVAVDDAYQVVRDTVLNVAAPGVLTNDTDADTSDSPTAGNASDPANGSVTLNADGSFSYTPDTGFTGTDTFTYDVDDGTATDSGTVTITVVPPNAAPTADNTSASGNEDGGAITVNLSGDDADGNTLSFSIVTGPSNGTLGTVVFVGCTGTVPKHCTATVPYTPNLNYNGPDSFTYKVNDGTVDSASPATASITVNSVNDTPTDIALSGNTVVENTVSGTTVGTFSTTDVDPDTHTYTLVSGTGSTGNGSFSITGSTLKTAAAFDFETQSSYSIRVRSTDSGTGNLFFEKQFTITVTDVNEAPTNIALSPASLPENSPAVTNVGTLTSTDQDAANTHTYTLVTGTGDADNASFTISGSTLKTATSFDYETQSSYSVRVRSTDQGGLFFEKQLTVTVTNVNETPTDIALTSQAVDENQPSATAVGVLSTTDPDVGDSATYTLVAGTGSTDNASFSITGSSLKTAVVFNFEVKNSYSVRIRTTDAGGLFYEEAFTITINDVNDAPVAVDDVYNNANGNTDAIGNTKFSLSVAGETGPVKNATGSALTNDSDEDQLPSPDTLSISFGTPAHGTILTGNTNGTFVYLPNAAFVGNDTVSYTLTDGEGGSDTGQITIQVANMVWYVDDSALVAGTGRSNDPYQSLASLQGSDLDVTGDTLFVYSGTYTTGIPLESGQKLYGQPQGLSVDGTLLVTAGGSKPAISSTTGHVVQLHSGANEVQDVSLGASPAGSYSLFAPSGVGAFTVADTDINNTSGGALNIADGTPSVTLGTLSSSGSSNNAVRITDTEAGSVMSSSGTLSNATSATFFMNNANTTVTLGSAISDDQGQLVSVTGGSSAVTYNDTITDGEDGDGDGIAITGTSGAHNFTKSVRLSTGSSNAFSMTNSASGSLRMVPTANTNRLATTSGAALIVTDTPIHANGLSFEKISAQDPTIDASTYGIHLSNTGSAGSLTVAGTGSADSGGIITGKSTGIKLNNTTAPSFTRMKLTNHGDFAIKGDSVAGFTLADSVIDGSVGRNGNDANADEGAVSFDELSGSATISNSTIKEGYENDLRVRNDSGTLNRLTVTSTTFGGSSAEHNDSVQLEANSAAILNATIQTSTFTSARGDQIQATVQDNAAGDIQVLTNTLTNSHATSLGGGIVLTAAGSGDMTYAINNNNITGAKGSAIVTAKAFGTVPSNGTAVGTISGNTIGNAGVAGSGSLNGSGIDASVLAQGKHSVQILNNTIRQYRDNGILLQAGGAASSVTGLTHDGDMNYTVTGNTIALPNGTGAGTGGGIFLNSGTNTGDVYDVCLNMSGNTITGSAPLAVGSTDLFLRQRFDTVVRLPGYTGPEDNGSGTLTASMTSYWTPRFVGAFTATYTAVTGSPGGYFNTSPAGSACSTS